MTVQASGNPPLTAVSVGGVQLDATRPFLVGTTASATGTLNGTTCTAHFVAATGTLNLWNYTLGSIRRGVASGAFDLAINLKGTNTITGNINLPGGGDLTITADEAATLSITNVDSNSGVWGIGTEFGGFT
jgi:hypothetical protein